MSGYFTCCGKLQDRAKRDRNRFEIVHIIIIDGSVITKERKGERERVAECIGSL
jgi:hypothetical protein